LIFSDGKRLGIYESVRGEGRELGAGVFGLSNHFLDTPWPKVTNLKSRLLDVLGDWSDEKAVLALLRDDRPAVDELLPSTGMSLEMERLLSSAFIRAPHYGTRSSTIIRIDQRARVSFDEWTWDRAGAEVGKVNLHYELDYL
jgi:uncharacterized protein with NRDE domain